MEVDAEELVGRAAATLMALRIRPDLIPREGRRCLVGFSITALGEECRALFTAEDDVPILKLVVFLEQKSHRHSDDLLRAVMRTNVTLAAGAFAVETDGERLTYYTSAVLGTDDPLPTQTMIDAATQDIESALPELLGTAA